MLITACVLQQRLLQLCAAVCHKPCDSLSHVCHNVAPGQAAVRAYAEAIVYCWFGVTMFSPAA
jgi:hypothetical protein